MAAMLIVPVMATPAPEAGADPTARPPNILLIVTDDQSWSTFNRDLMPNVFSRIVDRGTLYRRGYVTSPLCCPSRSEIFTGLRHDHTGVDNNHTPLLRPTIVDALQDLGYRTMLSGKYMNSHPCDPRPEFDRWVCGTRGEGTSGSLLNPKLNVNGTWQSFRGFTLDILADYLSGFIASTPADQPFFAMYTPPAPHTPADDPRYSWLHVPPLRPPSYDEETRTESHPEHMQRPPLVTREKENFDRQFRLMTRSVPPIDDAIGTILDALGSRTDDTLIIFLSDNGYFYGQHRRGWKEMPYEESVGVPFAVSYPALSPGGEGSDALVQNIDIAPTIAEAIGIPWGGDGRSLLPLIKGDATSIREGALIAWCQGAHHPCPENEPAAFPHTFDMNWPQPSYWGIIEERYKLIRYITGEEELFDLFSDPYELNNLANDPDRQALKTDLRAGIDALRATDVDTTIVRGPIGEITERHASFMYFSQSRLATYECRLTRDGEVEPWDSCGEQHTTRGSLPDGDYIFEVAGTDEAGATDPTPASRAFSIHSSGPDVSIGLHPAAHTKQSHAAFTISSPEPDATFECRLLPLGGSAPWQACPGDTAIERGPLSDGVWNFEARAVVAGIRTAPPAEWLFQVDNVGPHFIFDVRPWPVTQLRSAEFIFHPSEPVSGPVLCALDEGPPEVCSDGAFESSGLTEDSHVLELTATDALGNEATTRSDWRIDSTPPTPRIISGPSGFASSNKIQFKFASNEPLGGFQCKLDQTPLWFCRGPMTYSGLSDGPHTFTVHAYDQRLNFSGPVTRTWTQDTVPPKTTITAGPPSRTSTRSATFQFAANESGVSFRCRLDDQLFKACSSPTTYTGLSVRTHAFYVRATDKAGNTGPTVSRSWSVTT